MTAQTRKDEVLNRLTAGVAELTSSDAWQEWLKVQSRLHNYSFLNCLLIRRQCPEATRVAGFHTWRKLGRHVRKGERGIWILAPVTRKIDVDEEPEPIRTVTGFRPVAVFDIAQTDGEELAEAPCHRIEGDDPTGLYDLLVDVARSIGYSVSDIEFDEGTNGECDYLTRSIAVTPKLSPAQRVKTLTHELGHAMLHEGMSDRQLAELEAESVAYVVCSALGINSGSYSFAYVAGWAGGGDEAIAAIKTAGGRIQQTSDRILSALEAGQAAPSSGDESAGLAAVA